MNARVLTRVAAKSILRNKMRSLLTMLGIIIGVAAVLVMIAVGEGAQSQIEKTIQNLGTNMLVVTPGSSAAGGVSQGAGTFNRLSLDDAEKIRREAVLVTAVSPVIFTRTQAVGGEGNWRTTIYGVDLDYATIRDWAVSSGSFFGSSDIRSKRKVAVIGRTVADQLYPGIDPVGQSIRLRDVPFEIIGVLNAKGQTADGADQDDVILAPYTTVQYRLAGRQFIAQILAATDSPAAIDAAQEELTQILRESHRLGDRDPDDFTVRNQTQITEAAQGTTRVMTWLLAAIASISLLVGGIGIMNIMLVSVTERTREIGIRMAIGARGGDVLRQFLIESTVMSIVGGLLGVLLGFAASWILGNATGWAVQISPRTIAVALGFSGAVGMFFGWYPARKAARMDPIEALRYE
ncbi:MAG: ABC transporter permease [bacterium]